MFGPCSSDDDSNGNTLELSDEFSLAHPREDGAGGRDVAPPVPGKNEPCGGGADLEDKDAIAEAVAKAIAADPLGRACRPMPRTPHVVDRSYTPPPPQPLYASLERAEGGAPEPGRPSKKRAKKPPKDPLSREALMKELTNGIARLKEVRDTVEGEIRRLEKAYDRFSAASQ